MACIQRTGPAVRIFWHSKPSFISTRFTFFTILAMLALLTLWPSAGPAWASEDLTSGSAEGEAVALVDRVDGVYKTLAELTEKLEYEKKKSEGMEEQVDPKELRKAKIRRRLSAHLRPGGQATAGHSRGTVSRRWVDWFLRDAAKLSDEVAALKMAIQKAKAEGKDLSEYEVNVEDCENRAEALIRKAEARMGD